MYSERFTQSGDGRILRLREVQTELAEWDQLESGGWVRRMRRWEADDSEKAPTAVVP